MAKNYFDKFIEDQLRREELDRVRRQKLQVHIDDDPKRQLLRRYRENIHHLKVWKKND
jgi:hypothetical protein